MTATRSFIASIVVGTLVATPIAVGAQAAKRWVITPYAGVYVPTANLLKFDAASGGQSASLAVEQKTAFALGANASYWFSERTALELGGAYAFSDAKASATLAGTSEAFAGSGSQNAYTVMASAKVMVNLLPATSPMSLRLGVGPAMITRGGDAYKSTSAGKFSGLTDVGGALSLCTKIPVTKDLAVRLRGEDYMYSAKLKFEQPADPTNNFAFDSRFQHDLLFSVGLQFPFGR